MKKHSYGSSLQQRTSDSGIENSRGWHALYLDVVFLNVDSTRSSLPLDLPDVARVGQM